MISSYLKNLPSDAKIALRESLLTTQNGVCFICGKEIDLQLQGAALDIDHVIPLLNGGADNPSNFALTHAQCNRSKQASNLEVARLLHRFADMRSSLVSQNRSPNLGDVLSQNTSTAAKLKFKIEGETIKYSVGSDPTLHIAPLLVDDLSKFKSFFAKLPINCLGHDERINPRSIGANISKLVEEFHQGRPQLHIPLAWINSKEGEDTVHVFDGQHKAAAQILLGVKALPVRVFIDPNLDVLITTNTNAGTTLKQVAFDKSVQRHLGSTLYRDRIDRFRKETNRPEDDFSFSEKDLVAYFKGQSREVSRYVFDNVRDNITHSSDNRLRDFVDMGGRGKERPISYASVEKTFYSFFIHQKLLETSLDYKESLGENPRRIEVDQIIKLMNIIADEIFVGKFSHDLGTDRIESKIQAGEIPPLGHLIAFRMSKEEIMYNWLKIIVSIIEGYFATTGQVIDKERIFQNKFSDQLWENIRKFIRNLAGLPVWVDLKLSETVFGGKQNYPFWLTIFSTGKTPQNTMVLQQPINYLEMMK